MNFLLPQVSDSTSYQIKVMKASQEYSLTYVSLGTTCMELVGNMYYVNCNFVN